MILKPYPDSPAGIEISGGHVRVQGGPNIGISTFDGIGTVVRGPFHIMARPDQIRIWGLWKFNPLLLSMIPSTIFTPMPVLILDPPIAPLALFAARMMA